MESISLKNIRQNELISGLYMPKTINYQCPYCEETVSGIREKHTICSGSEDATVEIRCTSCNENSKIWIPEFDSNKKPKHLYMYQSKMKEKSIMQDIDSLPSRLKDAYLETIDVYKNGKWAATSVMCRRTLEGIVYYLYGADKENKRALYQNLKELPQKVDLTDKLIQLADGIRKAGNFGAHFDEDIETDEEIATMLVEYIEYLLEFSFVLPSKAEDLHKRVESLVSVKVDNQ